jgi:hypothetical protein
VSEKPPWETEESPPWEAEQAASLPEASYGWRDVLKEVPGALKEAPGQLLEYGTGLLKGGAKLGAGGINQFFSAPMGVPVPGTSDPLEALTGMDRRKRLAAIEKALNLAPQGQAQGIGTKVAEAIPYFTPMGGAGAMSKAALEAAKAASVTQAGGGSPTETALAGGLGAAGQGITSLGEALAPGLRAGAASLFQKAIQPTRESLKAAVERITPEALKRGISGSLPEITQEAAGNVRQVGDMLASVYDRATASGAVHDARSLVAKIDALKGPFHVLSKGGGTVRPVSEQAINSLENTIMGAADGSGRITPRDLWEVRKALDEILAGPSGAGFDVAKRGVKGATDRISKAAAKILQDELDKLDPGLGAMNKEFGFWNDLLKGAKATKTRRVGQEGALTARLVGAGLGGAIGGYEGRDYQSAGVGTLLGAAGGKKALEIMQSPAFRTASAQVRTQVANLIEAGQIDEAVKLLGRAVGRGIPFELPYLTGQGGEQ